MVNITTAQAAERLNVTTRRVQALIKARRLPAERFGDVWVIDDANLALVDDRKPGRPPKA